MKNSRTRDLQASRAVPQPTASPRDLLNKLSTAKMGKDIDRERRIARIKRS